MHLLEEITLGFSGGAPILHRVVNLLLFDWIGLAICFQLAAPLDVALRVIVEGVENNTNSLAAEFFSGHALVCFDVVTKVALHVLALS